ncbi:MAG: hypothetical protein KIS78_10225 [Labilithrix sp.]|nr:hypothetical protein [Labilithrix sp.]MCW5832774.1 hypothetical protein [Labilithrix sp.]
MKTKQMKTMGRLIDVKRRAVDAAEAAHAAAHARTRAAEQARIHADRTWLAALDAADHIGLVADLEDRDAQIRALRRAVDQAEQRHALARSEELAAREAMTEARVELRRFERWLEKAVAEGQAEQRQRERVAEDEVAARKLRAG